jgi:pectin methylesterase-like acyl-CoA thioesterase
MHFTLALACLLQTRVARAVFDRVACQSPTKNPAQGCPRGTLVVGAGQKFETVQSAIVSMPNNTTPYYVLILPGNYTEQVNVTRPGPVYLLGQTRFPEDNSRNTVNIIWHNATGAAVNSTLDNAWTSTLTVAPTFNASATGSGPTGNPVPAWTPFGNSDFRAYNLNFINDYRPYSSGPSLTLSVSYANTGFYYCGFYSYQDTVRISCRLHGEQRKLAMWWN